MRAAEISFECPCQLFVEGNDDKNFFEALIGRIHLPQRVEVQTYQGRDRLRAFLRAFVKHRDFDGVRSLGIVRDADTSSKGAFMSVAGTLAEINKSEGVALPVPKAQQQFVEASCSVGVMILSDKQGHGMLESVILKTLVGDPAWPCVERFVECLRLLDPQSIPHPEKSYVHAFIAGTESPHLSVGHAAKRGVFDLNHVAFKDLHDFLKRLASFGNNGEIT